MKKVVINANSLLKCINLIAEAEKSNPHYKVLDVLTYLAEVIYENSFEINNKENDK